MQVRSPVGTFPLKVRRVRLQRGGVSLDTTLGAWASEVRFGRSDVGLLSVAVGALMLSFLAGRASVRRGR